MTELTACSTVMRHKHYQQSTARRVQLATACLWTPGKAGRSQWEKLMHSLMEDLTSEPVILREMRGDTG